MLNKLSKKLCLAGLTLVTSLCCVFGVSFAKNAKTVGAATTAQTPTSNFYMKDGASIRLTEGSTGIRFTAQLKAAAYDKTKTYGVIITPTKYLTGNSITDEYITNLDTKYGFTEEDGEQIPKGYLQMTSTPTLDENGTDYIVQGSIAQIKYDNINVDFTGIAYEYDGTNYKYADINGDGYTNISRSVARVAAAAYNEYAYEGDPYNYGTSGASIISGFLKQSKNKAKGNAETAMEEIEDTLTLSKESIDVVIGVEQTLTAQANIPTSDLVWESSDKNVVTVSENGVLTALKKGTATITAKNGTATATCEVTANVDTTDLTDNYLATFSSEGYGTFFTSEGEAYPPTSITTEYVENVTLGGATVANAIKAVIQVPRVGNLAQANFKLYLPKAITQSTYTMRLLVVGENLPSDWWVRTKNASDGGDIHIGTYNRTDYATCADAWLTVVGNNYFNEYIQMFVGSGSTYTTTITVYFDCIIDGNVKDTLQAETRTGVLETLVAKGLGDNYLADYSSNLYGQTVMRGTCNEIKAEYVESKIDTNGAYAKNVLKVSAKAGKIGNYLYGDYYLYLPKSLVGTKYTIRFMYSSESTAAAYARTILSTEGGALNFQNYTADLWHTVEYDNANNTKDYFRIRVGNDTSGLSTSTTVLYFDCVLEGGQTKAVATQARQDALDYLATTDTGDYLADFSSNVYTNVFSANAYGSDGPYSMTAEYVSEMDGTQDGAIKLTIKAKQYGTLTQAYFKLHLPKAMTGSHKMRLRISSEGLENYSNQWWVRAKDSANTQMRIGDADNTKLGDDVARLDNWLEVNAPSADKDYIQFYLGINNYTGEVTYTIYFDWVK